MVEDPTHGRYPKSLKGSPGTRHIISMTLMKFCILFAAATLSLWADDTEELRAVLHRFNEAVGTSEAGRTLRTLFTPDADYRDSSRTLKGGDVVAALFTNSQAWSERTRPHLQEQAIRSVGASAALIDASLVQYGSAIGRSSVPVVLLIERASGGWRISSWRMPECLIAPAPQ